MSITYNDFNWCNNSISKKFAEEYPHDFSTEDIDGVIRKNYISGSKWNTRFIIYECKHNDEKYGDAQRKTLYLLSSSIKWENFDEKSGIFVFQPDNETKNVNVYKINGTTLLSTLTFDQLYQWISAKDKTLNKI